MLCQMGCRCRYGKVFGGTMDNGIVRLDLLFYPLKEETTVTINTGSLGVWKCTSSEFKSWSTTFYTADDDEDDIFRMINEYCWGKRWSESKGNHIIPVSLFVDISDWELVYLKTITEEIGRQIQNYVEMVTYNGRSGRKVSFAVHSPEGEG